MLFGHDVVIIRDGHEALERLSADTDFDVILCDVRMPGLSGSELFTRVTLERPELKSRFVFMTGGAFTQYGRSFLETVGCPVLHKPFDPAVVLESVENLARTRHVGGDHQELRASEVEADAQRLTEGQRARLADAGDGRDFRQHRGRHLVVDLDEHHRAPASGGR